MQFCRAGAKDGGQQEGMVVLDGAEGGEADASTAAAFAQQMLAGKARKVAKQNAAGTSLEHGHGSERHKSPAEARTMSVSATAEKIPDSASDDDVAELVVDDSDDDLALLDKDEEEQLLRGSDSPVDVKLLSQAAATHPDRGKENISLRLVHAHAPHKSSAGQADLLPGSSSRRDDISGQRAGSRPGRKQLQRLYDIGSAPEQQKRPEAHAAGLDSDDDLLDKPFLEASRPGKSKHEPPAQQHRVSQEELQCSWSDDDGTADHSAEQPQSRPSGSCQPKESAVPAWAVRRPAAQTNPDQAHRSASPPFSLRSELHTNDSWDRRQPQSSGPSLQQRSMSPEASQQRSCGQVRFA